MEPFGSVHQQLWSILHFPFHLALALMMEGTNQILLCTHVVQDLFKLSAPFQGEATPQVGLITLNETVHTIYERFPSTEAVINEVEESLHALLEPATNATQEETLANFQLVLRQMAKTVIEGYGWEPPKAVAEEDFSGYANSIVSIFNLTFGNYLTSYIDCVIIHQSLNTNQCFIQDISASVSAWSV
jgi:hypothetical protein